ncbi:MAG TPA: NHLP bacteriocin system secretion protein [Stellaceae bacterium]|nr:NHLP bacteriocin system secretion protein [Stellaceae bacterium]
MSDGSGQASPRAAIERLSSPEHLDQLVRITRPSDWIATTVICLGLAALVTWGFIGSIPTRISGEGILISEGGRVVDAVSAVGGRLASIDVAVGDRVVKDQVIAHLAQTDTDRRYHDAVEVLQEREREDAQLASTIESELAAKAANYGAQVAALNQVVDAAQQRSAYLATDVGDLEKIMAKGFVTRRELEDRRNELSIARQKIADARAELVRLSAQKLDTESQAQRDRLASQFRVNDARREMELLAGSIDRDSRLISATDGRVIEVKVSPGAVLAVGTPVIEIESEASTLQAVIYIPGDRGKSVQVGMQVQVEPATVKREEFGALIGKVLSISDFPVTPQGMAAVLHNESLVSRFSRDGAPYVAMIGLQRDAATASGYHWSSGAGPAVRITTGTLARADVTTRVQPPIDLLVPLIKRVTGIEG